MIKNIERNKWLDLCWPAKWSSVSSRGGRGGMRVRMSVRWGSSRRRNDAVVDLLADEVDAEGHQSDAEAGSGVAELIRQHRVLPPLVPPPEELPCRPQRLFATTPHPVSLFFFLLILKSFSFVNSDDERISCLSPSLKTYIFGGGLSLGSKSNPQNKWV